jgi:uncharacterized protein (DUF433 family)/predicted DNA-binding transcriptional regulator AlpA
MYDVRVTTPICTPNEVSTLVGMPRSTVYSWMKAVPEHRPQLIHRVTPEFRGWPSIPLIGLAEASVIRALRDGGMAMPEIAAAVEYLRKMGGEYALGRPELVTDNVTAFIAEEGGVYSLRHGQGVLLDIVKEYLHPFTLAPDGFVQAYLLPQMPGVEIDPRFSSGRMRFTRTGVPLFAVAGLLEAGEDSEAVADEYGLRVEEVELVRERLPWLSSVA